MLQCMSMTGIISSVAYTVLTAMFYHTTLVCGYLYVLKFNKAVRPFPTIKTSSFYTGDPSLPQVVQITLRSPAKDKLNVSHIDFLLRI